MTKLITLVIIITAFWLGFFSSMYADIFSKRVLHSLSHKVFYDGRTTDTENVFTYTDSEPHLIECRVLTTVNTNSNGTDSTVVTSNIISAYSVDGDRKVIRYEESRDNYPGIYAYYRFIFDQNDDLVETIYQPFYSGDPLYAAYTYRNVHQPDSIFYQGNGSTSYYKMIYDQSDRLVEGRWYLFSQGVWNIFRRYTQAYNTDAYQYPNPLDFNNYRFYTLNYGFENSCPIFDKNYAPQTITYEAWLGGGGWYPIYSTLYGVNIYPDEIALFNTQVGSYTVYFYYNQDGTLTQSTAYYDDGTIADLNISWEFTTLTDDPVNTPVQMLLSCYPNPFTGDITISVSNAAKALYDVSVYNVKGQLVRQWKDVKSGETIWEGKDMQNISVSSGIYLVRIKQNNRLQTIKVFKR